MKDPYAGHPVVIPSRHTDGPKSKRTFKSGATRDTESDKLDYEGFLSPLVIERYAEYLHGHRIMSDGTVRDSDNWQKGMSFSVYMKSGYRHFFTWWKSHRGWFTNPLTSKCDRDKALEDTICGLLFNASGYLHEHLKKKLLTDYAGEADLVEHQPHSMELQSHLQDKHDAEKAFDEADLDS